jgi:type IV secretion system protein VirB6
MDASLAGASVMACPSLHTGSQFLATSLAHLDCQGQTIGAYGYGALADPHSGVFAALAALLTIFIALFGIRLMFGPAPTARDLVGDIIKIGIVLALATSWPAWRTVGYNLVINGPGELAANIGLASGLPGADGTLIARLQNADDGLVAMTMYGTGRLTGGVVGGSDLGDSFQGIAVADQSGFGWGRIAFLTGIIAPFAVTRIGAGLLLALAPLMAGLLLFGGTAGIFMGWARGLAFVAIASLALSVGAGVEIALIDPWIADVLAQRAANTFTPSAPTELTVLAMAFAIANLGMLALIGRILFFPHASWPAFLQASRSAAMGTAMPRDIATGAYNGADGAPGTEPRARSIADAVAASMRRENGGGVQAPPTQSSGADYVPVSARLAAGSDLAERRETLGNSYRRTRQRGSQAGQNRDRMA